MTGGGEPRRLILVPGAGGGVGLLVAILRRLGFRVPKPELDDADGQPSGEPRWVADFGGRPLDEEVRLAQLRSWLEVQFVGTADLLLAGPRVAKLLSLWRRAGGDVDARVSTIAVLASPAEESADIAVIRYGDLVNDWRGELARVGRLLELPALENVGSSASGEIDALVQATPHDAPDDHAMRAALLAARAAPMRTQSGSEGPRETRPTRRVRSTVSAPRGAGSRLAELFWRVSPRHRERVLIAGLDLLYLLPRPARRAAIGAAVRLVRALRD